VRGKERRGSLGDEREREKERKKERKKGNKLK
jgi:hypothetical protein